MRITRTYPQPDSPQPFIGPRERALAVFKYLMDLEPEAAVQHPRFELIVAAFKQAGVQAIRSWADTTETTVGISDNGSMRKSLAYLAGEHTLPPIKPSIAELLTGSTDSPDAEIKRFAPQDSRSIVQRLEQALVAEDPVEEFFDRKPQGPAHAPGHE